MLIQHYGTRTTLAKKLSASIKALQLKIGCIGNPFDEKYYDLYLLATLYWDKSLWEQLHYYSLQIYLNYPPILLPHKSDALLVHLFWHAGYRSKQMQALNQCQMTLRLLFLTDITTTCGRLLETSLLLKPARQNKSVSKFVFPNEQPECSDWKYGWNSEQLSLVQAEACTFL